MSDRAYKRWSCGLLLTLLLVLGACAAVVYWVDPCFYYRMPKDRAPVFFSERYQTAGIVRNNAADVVLLGSSMTANYRGSKVGAAFGGTGLRLTIPDGYYSEFDEVMTLLMRTHRRSGCFLPWTPISSPAPRQVSPAPCRTISTMTILSMTPAIF